MDCKRCGEFLFHYEALTHKCPPGWRVYCPDFGEEPEDCVRVFALNSKSAVELWARHFDEENALVDCREPCVVRVWPEDCTRGACEEYLVQGETAVVYSVRKAGG